MVPYTREHLSNSQGLPSHGLLVQIYGGSGKCPKARLRSQHTHERKQNKKGSGKYGGPAQTRWV